MSKYASKIVTQEQAEQAVETLLNYIVGGELNTTLRDTPARVIKSYKELFSGYGVSAESVLVKKFCDINEYDEPVLLKSINFTSTCEHHLLPFSGLVDIAYLPNKEVVGISKLARLVDIFGRRLQLQERMTAQIAQSLQTILAPKGVAVRIKATHHCMTHRGAQKYNALMESLYFTGLYKKDSTKRQEFLQSVR